MARIDRLRRYLCHIPHPGGAQLAGEGLRPGIPRARKSEHLPALPAQHLRGNMRRGAEAIQADAATLSGQAQRPPADQSGAQQRRQGFIGPLLGEREGKPGIRHGGRGEATVPGCLSTMACMFCM